ncbi:hypothetical protein HGO38_15300 [Rhizobium sp. CG5]|uniref:hypothetical protein n=1 Tax=Rhizobium sp. CG5 TaxID=2726076 RepID=UPI002033CACB|nr:hypothetical protein [Rhizobium sp. CG5]MCM2474846.1 hypothetical protein [Rhizobium sp. CG5]
MLINHDNAPSPPDAIVIAGRVIRSLLAVPMGDEMGIRGGLSSHADGLMIDLTARGAIAQPADFSDMLAQPDRPLLFFAVPNHADSDAMAAEVETLMAFAPAGVILGGVTAAAELQRLDVMLSVAEVRLGRPEGATAIVALCGDTPAGVLAAQQCRSETSARLAALGFDGRRLAQALRLPAPAHGTAQPNAIAVARGLVQLAAASAQLGCLDWIDPPLEGERLREACRAARDEGFSALVCTNADQIGAINAAYRDGRR